MASSAGYPAGDLHSFSPSQPAYYSPRGCRKDSISSNESSEGDDNIVIPRPPQSPPSTFDKGSKGTAGGSTFSPFAAEFAPASSESSFSSPSESNQSANSSHRAPSTPGLIDFDSPNSVDTPLDTPQHELPNHARQQQAQTMSSASANDSKPEWTSDEPEYEIADEILRLQIGPQQQSLTSRSATFPQSLSMAPMYEPPSASLGNSGLRRMTSPPPPPVRSPSPLRSKLHPSARPWSPSPLRYEQRPGSTATASTVTPGPRELHSTVAGWPSSPHPGQLPAPQVFTPTKLGSLDERTSQPFHLQQSQQTSAPEVSSRSRLSRVEAGEPENSFPLSAFSQWREQHNQGQHRPTVSSPSSPAPRSSAASPIPLRRGAAHRRQGSDTSLTSSRGSSVDVYDLRAASRPLSRTSQQQQQQFSPHHGQTPSAAPSPSTIPLSFLERQQRRQSAVMTASMASARRSSGSSAGSSGAFDLQEDFPRSRGTPPVSYAQQHGASQMYEHAAMLPGAGLPGAGLPPAPSPSSMSYGSHSHTPSPGAVNSLASLYQLNQLGVDPQTSDAILRLAATQPKVFAQLAGNTATSNNGSQGGPSPNNRKINLYKTELCRSWEEKGSCRYGAKCQFAHSKNELRVVNRHPKYKTQVCRTFWFTGECPYGRRCCFLHNTVPGDNTPLSPAGPHDQYMEQPELAGGYSMGAHDTGLSSRTSSGLSSRGLQQEPLASSAADASPHTASAVYGQFDACGDPYSSMFQQQSPWASRNLSRSSSANSNSQQQQQRGTFEPSEADHALLRGSSPQNLLIDLENIQRQQQQKPQPLYASQSDTSRQHMPLSPPNTYWKNAESFSGGSSLPFSDARSAGAKASIGGAERGSFATSRPSPSSFGPESPFSPYSGDPFNSPTSGSGTVYSPFTPMSATSQAPVAPLSSDEGNFAKYMSPEVSQGRKGAARYGDQSSIQGSPGYAGYGAIGAPRQPNSRRSSDNDDEAQSSGLAQHAKFLSQLAAATDRNAGSN